MAPWIRFVNQSVNAFGIIDDGTVHIHEGDMFGTSSDTGETARRDASAMLTPCVPGKMIALANNSRALAEKNAAPIPEYPQYFIKPANTYLANGETIRKPRNYDKRVFYEAELGIVIGKICQDVSEDEADACIFVYTCVNDVTAFQILDEAPAFPQWTRAKAFDTFAPFGPAIRTDLELEQISIRAVFNGRERQNYGVSDLIFRPRQIVSLLSGEISLFPGDLIACGTGPGALPMTSFATSFLVGYPPALFTPLRGSRSASARTSRGRR